LAPGESLTNGFASLFGVEIGGKLHSCGSLPNSYIYLRLAAKFTAITTTTKDFSYSSCCLYKNQIYPLL
jgi:hypothetical protein